MDEYFLRSYNVKMPENLSKAVRCGSIRCLDARSANTSEPSKSLSCRESNFHSTILPWHCNISVDLHANGFWADSMKCVHSRMAHRICPSSSEKELPLQCDHTNQSIPQESQPSTKAEVEPTLAWRPQTSRSPRWQRMRHRSHQRLPNQSRYGCHQEHHHQRRICQNGPSHPKTPR